MKQLSVSTMKIIDMSGEGREFGKPLAALLMKNGNIFAYGRHHDPSTDAKLGWARTNAEPTNVVEVAAGPGGYWCLDSDGWIYKWNESGTDSAWIKDEVAKDVTTMSCDRNGDLWCTNAKGEFFISKIEFTGDLSKVDLWIMGPWTRVDELKPWFM